MRNAETSGIDMSAPGAFEDMMEAVVAELSAEGGPMAEIFGSGDLALLDTGTAAAGTGIPPRAGTQLSGPREAEAEPEAEAELADADERDVDDADIRGVEEVKPEGNRASLRNTEICDDVLFPLGIAEQPSRQLPSNTAQQPSWGSGRGQNR
jgi:hypothetical protein